MEEMDSLTFHLYIQNNQIPICSSHLHLPHWEEGMATAFMRGAQTMNSMFFKPIGRKGFHRKSSSPDMMRERVETESKELKSNKSPVRGEETPWVLDGRTGIYYPKGHENVLESIPNGGGAAVNTQVNWFNDENS